MTKTGKTAVVAASALAMFAAILPAGFIPAAAAQATQALPPQYQARFDRIDAEDKAIRADSDALQRNAAGYPSEELAWRQASIVERARLNRAASVQLQSDLDNVTGRNKASAVNGGTAVPAPAPSQPGTATSAVAVQRTATSVIAGQSTFTYGPVSHWIETVNGQQVRSYSEDGRLENSARIVLVEASTSNRVTIDFLGNVVSYNGGVVKVPIVAVGSAVNGSNITGVTLSSGGSLRIKRGWARVWEERGAGTGGPVFTFQEFARGPDSISLRDTSRGINLEIVPSQKVVNMLTTTSSRWEVLYNITSSTAVRFFSVATID